MHVSIKKYEDFFRFSLRDGNELWGGQLYNINSYGRFKTTLGYTIKPDLSFIGDTYLSITCLIFNGKFHLYRLQNIQALIFILICHSKDVLQVTDFTNTVDFFHFLH